MTTTTDQSLAVVGLAGSLRTGSFNRALLRAARELAPPTMQIDVFDLAPIPPYNADADTDDRRPDAVTQLKAAITEADGVLLVSPEYNAGISGVMKNALDWASRPAFRSPMAGKPTGIMGASRSGKGTARAQEQAKLMVLSMLAEVFPHRGVTVGRAGEKFDQDLRLTDEKTREAVREYLADFAAWISRLAVPE